MDLVAPMLTAQKNGRPTLVVVPSTSDAFECIKNHAENQCICLVGDNAFLPSALKPATYLSACCQAQKNGTPLPSAFVFTDQLVDAPEATLFVRHNDVTQYVSSLELLALLNHHVDLYVWTATNFQYVRHDDHEMSSSIQRVLEALLNYYMSCARMDATWLARDIQRRRLHAFRCLHAAIRIRDYESALMLHFAGNALPDNAVVLLQRLAAMRTRVLRSRQAAI